MVCDVRGRYGYRHDRLQVGSECQDLKMGTK